MTLPSWWSAKGPVVAGCALVATVVASPVHGGVTSLGSSFDEIVERQSAGMESAFFGWSILGDRYGNSVAVHPVVGFYGDDGILSGIGGSWHTTSVVPWEAAVGVGVLDLDFTTWTIALSSSRRAWSNEHSAIVLEGAFGYQFYHEGPDGGTAIGFANSELRYDEVLLDTFRFYHVMAHAAYSLDLCFLRPMLDLGWVGTGYRFDGNVWDRRFPVTRGVAHDEAGFTTKMTFGFGAALDIDRIILFGGIKVVKDAALFQANAGFAF